MARKYVSMREQLRSYDYLSLAPTDIRAEYNILIKYHMQELAEILSRQARNENGKLVRNWDKRIALFEAKMHEVRHLMHYANINGSLSKKETVDSYLRRIQGLVDITFSDNAYVKGKYTQ